MTDTRDMETMLDDAKGCEAEALGAKWVEAVEREKASGVNPVLCDAVLFLLSR
jgi:hypothetical protein